MTQRTKLIAGNWKMNGRRADGLALAGALAERARGRTDGEASACELLICPPATLLSAVCEVIAGSGISLGRPGLPCRAAGGLYRRHQRRNAGRCRLHPCHPRAFRAPPRAWRDRRRNLRQNRRRQPCRTEPDPLRRRNPAAAPGRRGECGGRRAACGSIPDGIACDGLIVAYEPVWAIGTGLSATLDDIAAIHAAIRADLTVDARILYGGSVNPSNAAAIFAVADVDGALVGGASLDPDAFWAIARCCG